MGWFLDTLLWLDAPTWRYWSLASGTCAVLVGLALLPAFRPGKPRRGHAWVFVLTLLASLVAARWPVWFYPHELNPDESQMVAGAITLDRFPVYWKHVDGGTHGPVNEYLLLLMHWLGAPLSLGSARVCATLLQAVVAIGLWGTLRVRYAEHAARLAAAAVAVFWAFDTWDDFVHYSSELPALALLTAGCWLLALASRETSGPGSRFAFRALGGTLLGAVPWAKLQLAPLALLAGIFFLVAAWRSEPKGAPGARLKVSLASVIGAVFPTAVVGVFLLIFRLWEHAYVSYFASAVAYAGESTLALSQMPGRFLRVATIDAAFAWYLLGGLAFVLLRNGGVKNPIEQSLRRAAWGFLGSAFLCVLLPRREVIHYLQLLIVPLALLQGIALGGAETKTSAPGNRAAAAVGWFCLLVVLPQFGERAAGWHRFVGHLREHLDTPPGEAARYLREHAAPDDTVAMWGWAPHVLVEAGLPHGTREACTPYQVFDWPLRDYYVSRYTWDLERRSPTWFVDAVGMGAFVLVDRNAVAHERTPKVAEYVARNYLQVTEFGNFRIYRRRIE